jgi:hypothetical protein
MQRKIPVSVWLIAAAGVVGMFLLFQAYLKPCQPLKSGPCNTIYYGYCCPDKNLVCYRQKCLQLFPDARTFEY